MYEKLISIGLNLQIFLQFLCATFSLFLLKNKGTKTVGILFFFAFVLMGFRRVTALLSLEQTNAYVIVDKLILPLSITLFLTAAVWKLSKVEFKKN